MNRLYVVGPAPDDEHYDEEEYRRAYAVMEGVGFRVVEQPTHWNRRLEMATLTTCDAIALLDVWWTSNQARLLQAVAAWLDMPHYNALTGERVETVKV